MEISVSSAPRRAAVPAVFCATVFVSASLLFFVQPLYAKMVLPHLGGAPAVWATAMLFFQTALLLGYGYAHLISTRLGHRAQVGAHGLLWAVGLLFLPIAIPEAWSYDPGTHPATQTLLLLAVGIGVPFVALAANAPLLQKWYARSGGAAAKDPYHLYAASNAGSLIALLGYPLVAEPLARSGDISLGWTALYLALGIGLALCAVHSVQGEHSSGTVSRTSPTNYHATVGQWALWIALAFVPSSMMLGVTSTVSNELGAFPLIWVIPLALYLLTFVLAFSASLRPSSRLVNGLFTVLVPAAIAMLATKALPMLGLFAFLALFGAFFCVALQFHTRLHAARPPEAGLTKFYFAMGIGGALGGTFNSILAPVLFDSAIEVLVVFAIVGLALEGPWRPVRDFLVAGLTGAVVFGVILMTKAAGPTAVALALVGAALLAAQGRPLRFALTASVLLALGHASSGDSNTIFRDRSFFGTYTVRDKPEAGLRWLQHGTTLHGSQFIDDLTAEGPGDRPRILSYYHPKTPIGQIFTSGVIPADARVGVVGLGAGALACYAEPGQTWRFYEIDALIDQIARDPRLFSYMDTCARQAPTVLGDARVSLAREANRPFDLLVIDAYSSDAIPIHLITIEALELYFSRLKPGGLLALHISNRYYDLAAILGSAADELDVPALVQFARGPMEPGQMPSTAVLMAAEPTALRAFLQDSRWQPLKASGGSLWTDDHASLLDAL